MNRLTKTGLAACMFLAISCSKEAVRNPDAVSTPDVESTPTKDITAARTTAHFIGKRFGGGIIFWLNKTKDRGLIADTVDLRPAQWWNGTITTLVGTTESGRSNTQKIVTAQGTSRNYAALECANSNRSGFTDWFLPSKEELNRLFKQKNVVGGFASNDYWSSSLFLDGYPFGQHFGTGHQNYNIENYFYFVRAIRSF